MCSKTYSKSVDVQSIIIGKFNINFWDIRKVYFLKYFDRQSGEVV